MLVKFNIIILLNALFYVTNGSVLVVVAISFLHVVVVESFLLLEVGAAFSCLYCSSWLHEHS